MVVEQFFTDHLLIVIAALLLNALLGGPRRIFAPVAAYYPARQLAHAVRFLEKRLNRDRRPAEERRTRGLVLVTFVLMLALFGGTILAGILRSLSYGVVVEVALVACLLALRSSYDRAADISAAVQREDPDAAREAFEGTVWRNAALLDAHGLSRAAVEMLAMSFAQKVLSPAFFYVLMGLPGLFASRAVTMLAEILAPGSAQGAAFGWAAHGVYRWVMALPNMLAAALLALASLVSPTARPRQALRALMLQWREPSLEAATLAPIAVMAASADIALGGPASVYVGGDWVGRGTLRPAAAEIRKASYVFVLATAAFLLLLAIMAAA